MTTAEKIKRFRLLLQCNQREFADYLGITPSAIAAYESGKREPSFATMRKMLSLAKKKSIKLKLEDIRDNL